MQRLMKLLREDAAVMADRRGDSMTWRAWVATPGQPQPSMGPDHVVGEDAGLDLFGAEGLQVRVAAALARALETP